MATYCQSSFSWRGRERNKEETSQESKGIEREKESITGINRYE
jgi:hypothetical protein